MVLPTVLLLVCAVLELAVPTQADAASRCQFAAHRGYTAHATENGLRAFRYAIARRADYLEMDVQVTRDGRFVPMHDKTINRTTNGRGRVIDLRWRRLSRLHLNDGSPVPTLRRVLRMAKPSGVKVLLEMKWIPSARFGSLYRVVKDFGRHRVVVHSFSPYVARRFHQRFPAARSGIDVARPIPVRRARSYGGVLPDYRHVTGRWLRKLRAAGVPTYLSTLNSRRAWRRYSGKVSVIVTDRALDYRAYRRHACR